MIRIMFVCHGNICRSPMAEFIMKDIVKKAGKEKEYFIASSATSTEEIGCHIYYPAQTELNRRGVPFDANRRAAQLTKADYDKYDYIVVMEKYNAVNALKNLGGRDDEGKVRRLLDFTDHPGDIDDPWWTDRFDVAFEEISCGCLSFFDFLEKKRST